MIPQPALINLSRTTLRSLAVQSRSISSTIRLSTSKDSRNQQHPANPNETHDQNQSQQNQSPKQDKRKTVAQTDAELRERLEQMSGEGGAAGIEYEDGQPNTMKRSVRNNMFRYI